MPLCQYEYIDLLKLAATNNDLESLLFLLEKVRGEYPVGFITNDRSEGTVLHTAAEVNCLPVIMRHLLLPANQRYVGSHTDRDGRRRTPLHCAAKNISITTATMLLAKGADVNARDWFQETPLHYAASVFVHGKKRIIPESAIMEMISLLLDNRAAINAKNPYNGTALYDAVLTGNLGVVSLLLERGADISIDVKSFPIAHQAIQYGAGLSDKMSNIEMLELVLGMEQI